MADLVSAELDLQRLTNRRVDLFLSRALKPYADFFCGKPNGISFPYSSDEIRFVAFFLKLVGT